MNPPNRHLRVQVISLIIAGSLLLVACGGGQPAPTSTPLPQQPNVAAQPTTATQPTTAPQNTPMTTSDGDFGPILDAYRAQLAAPSFRMTMLLVSDDETLSEMIEFVAPDRFRLAMEDGDIVVIGETAYELYEGVYEMMEDGGSMARSLASVTDPSEVEELAAHIVSVTALGRENLNGANLQVYEYIARIEDQVVSNKIWISEADGRPYRVDQIHEEDMLIIEYDYGADIVIEDPAAAN